MAVSVGSMTIGSQHLALRDQVLAELRHRIVNGDYPPGQRLTEDRLAADFGVSRNPVREALRIVQAEGLVTMAPRRGAVVSTPDASTIADLFAVRTSLETVAARLAAERATPGDVSDLRTPVSYTHLRAHETRHELVCRLLLEKK